MARIADVMSLKVISVRPEETVQVAITRMIESNVGSIAITDGGRLEGIFTERDVLALAGQGSAFGELKIGDVMTRRVVTVSPDDDIFAAARLMSERRIRHLPVVEGENVLGIVGIRDVMRTLLEIVWRDHDATARETARELLSRPSPA